MKVQSHYLDDPRFLDFLLERSSSPGFWRKLPFYISKFQPISILKGKLKFGGNNWMTYMLLTLQFIISLTGIVCSLAFIDNAQYQHDFDLGFDRKGAIFTWVNGRSEYETYRNALYKIRTSDLLVRNIMLVQAGTTI